LIELFEKYVRWKVLAKFLANPNTSFHIKEVARALEISPASASSAAKYFEGFGLLVKEERGQAHLYKLDSEHCLAAPLKKAYGLTRVISSGAKEKFLGADNAMISLALFGSYADGSFDEKSDVDFLIVTPSGRERLVSAAKELEGRLGKEVGISVFKLSEWRLMGKKGDAFYRRVAGNHVLLYGSGLE